MTLRLQDTLRLINDEIAERADGVETAAYVCECLDRGCAEAVEVPVELYRQMRLVPNRFMVCPDHVDGPSEFCVVQERSYAIVERAPLGQPRLTRSLRETATARS